MSLRKKPNTLLLNMIIKCDMNKRSQPISKKYFFHPPPRSDKFLSFFITPQKHFNCHEESRGKRILTLSALSRSCQFLTLSDRTKTDVLKYRKTCEIKIDCNKNRLLKIEIHLRNGNSSFSVVFFSVLIANSILTQMMLFLEIFH